MYWNAAPNFTSLTRHLVCLLVVQKKRARFNIFWYEDGGTGRPYLVEPTFSCSDACFRIKGCW